MQGNSEDPGPSKALHQVRSLGEKETAAGTARGNGRWRERGSPGKFSPKRTPQRLAHGLTHLTFIFREWICMILARASSLGMGNSILRSSRPERSRAGSRMSTLLVAAMT